MKKPTTYTEVIDLWPTRQALADAMGNQVTVNVVHLWANRNSIPSRHWSSIIKAAKSDGIHGFTLSTLADIAKKQGK